MTEQTGSQVVATSTSPPLAERVRAFGVMLALIAVPWSGGALTAGLALAILAHLRCRPWPELVGSPWVGRGALTLAAAVLLSAILSTDRAEGIAETRGFWPLLAIFPAAAAVKSARNAHIFPACLAVSAALAAVYLIGSCLLVDGFPGPRNRMLPLNAWRLNAALAHGTACGLYGLVMWRSLRVRLVGIACASLCVGALAMVGERMPVMLVFAFITLATLIAGTLRSWTRRQAIIAVGALAGIIVLAFSTPQLQRLATMPMSKILAGETTRLAMWESAFTMFGSSPIFGVGIGDAAVELHRHLLEDHGIANAPGTHAHSNLFHMLAAGGAIGGVAYLVFAFTTLLPWLRRDRIRTSSAFLALWAWGFLVLWGVIEGTIFQSYFLMPFCVLYAVGLGVATRDEGSARAAS